MNLFLYALSVVIVNLFLYALSVVNLKEGIQMKHFKNLELTAGAILASLAGSSLASANHSTTAHATTVVSNESSKTDTKQNDGSKTLNITTAKAEADAKSKNGEGTSPLKATTDSDVPLSPSDAKSQIDNVNKSNEKKNLDQAVDEAKKTDGIQVIKDANVQYQASKTSENDVKKDYQSQADTIKKQVEDQKQKLADYNTKKQAYDKNRQSFIDNLKKEGLWKEGTTDPSTLSQHLVLNQEPDAKAQYTILNSAGNVTEQDVNWNSHQEYTLTFDKSISGDILKVTYTDLKNSTYNGKKISKIEETFSGLKGVNGKGTLRFYNNPYQGFWYAGTSGITANMKFFDEDGKQITFDNNAPAYLTVSSLNGRTHGGTEKVRLLSNGKAIQIPESAITVHDNNTLYSDKDTYFAENYTNKDYSSDIAKKYQNWDNATSPNKIFGSGLYQVSGDSITLRCFSDNDDKPATPAMVGDGGIWFTFSATVPQTSFDANGPQKPITTIHYHDDEIQIPASITASITVKYVDQDTGKEISDTQFNQKGNEGDSITYTTADTISKLQLQGYTLVSDDFTGKAGDKLSEANNGKTYVVTLKKQNQDKPSTPETKNGTQTYHFVDKNTGKILTTDKVGGKVGEDVSVSLKVPDGYHLVAGQTVPTSANIKDKDNPINILVEKDPTPAKPSTPETKDGTQTIHIIDKKTGNVLTTVVKGGKIGENIPVSLKVPKGYHLVQGQKLPTSVNIKDKDNAINVYVEKDEAKPAVTTPSNNNDKTTPTPAPVENAKSTDNKVAKPTNVSDAKAPSASVANNTTSSAPQATLPQTGDSSSTAGVLAGSTLLATMASLGIAYKKKRNA